MKGILLHGGYGTRLRPLTYTGPKQLIPVANKPISQYVLESLRDSGIYDIAIVLGDIYPDKVKEHYGDGSQFGAKITYIYQSQPKGIAHAIGLCKKYIDDEPFIVYLGDNLLKGGIKEFAETFEKSNYDALILLCEVVNPQRFGVAKFDENGKLMGLVEKPKYPPSNYALTGIYFLKPTIFKMIKQLKPSWRGELEITEAIRTPKKYYAHSTSYLKVVSQNVIGSTWSWHYETKGSGNNCQLERVRRHHKMCRFCSEVILSRFPGYCCG